MEFAKRIFPFLIAAVMTMTAPAAMAQQNDFAAADAETDSMQAMQDDSDQTKQEDISLNEEGSESVTAENETGTDESTQQQEEINETPAEQEEPDLQTEPAENKTDENIVQAENIEEYIEATQPDEAEIITIDKDTGKTSGEESLEELTGQSMRSIKKEGIPEAVEESDQLEIVEETDDQISVCNVYDRQRILVSGKVEKSYGEVEGSYFDGDTVLQFASESDTEKAYHDLVEDFGEENVILDTSTSRTTTGKIRGWGVGYMGMDYKQKCVAGKKSVQVAIMDSGVRQSHNAFEGRKMTGYNFISPGKTVFTDQQGHGTEMAGIIAESTPSNVSFMILKTIDDEGYGSLIAELQALDYIRTKKPDVVNMSFGGYLDDVVAKKENEKLKSIYDQGIIMCAAAGNGGENMDITGKNFFPAESQYVLCVGAVKYNGARCYYSNYGSALDFMAPGEAVAVPANTSSSAYYISSGTSIACPYIAAGVALLRTENKSNTTNQVMSNLSKLCKDVGASGKDRYYGYGVPNFGQDPNAKSLSGVKSTFKVKSPVIYNGKMQQPTFTSSLMSGRDYSYTYVDSINAGTGKVFVQGVNGYKGSMILQYNIKPKKAYPSVKMNKASYVYTGNIIKPNMTISTGKTSLAYTTSYPDGAVSIGTHKVVITLTGNYTGSTYAYFKIIPKSTKIKKATSGKRSITVIWNKGQKYYEISVKQTGTNKEKRYRSTNTSLTVKGLKINKKYTIKVRTYKTVNGTRYYSAWSTAKTIRTKKQ